MEMIVRRIHCVASLLIVAVFSLPDYAVSQQVSLSATSLSFAPQLAGSVSAAQTLTLRNSGTTILTVSSITASGGYIVSSNCATLNPGAACAISVKFISQLVGTDNGTITISDSTASSPQLVNLAGFTLPPLTLSPSTMDFGSAAVGTTSQSKPITLTNHGPGLSVATIAVSGDYLQINNCPVMLSSGASCTINVAFHPTVSGPITGALSISSNNSGVSAVLSGTGTGNVTSHVLLQPAKLDFGGRSALDIFTHSKTVTLTNASSSVSLSIQSIFVNGPTSSAGAPVYQIDSTDCKGMLAPGGQCRITISVGNSIPVPKRVPGALTILDSDATSPQVVPLSLTELPEVAFIPAALTFGPQQVGTSSVPRIVTLSSNLDEAGISLMPLTVSGDYHVVAAGSNPCGNSPGFNGLGSTCTIGVVFSPKQAGVIHGAVTFTLYPECSPEQVIILHQPCPAAQEINLTGIGQ